MRFAERLIPYFFGFVWLLWCIVYVALPEPSFDFAGDVGGCIVTLGRMASAVTSPAALGAMFNWQTWNDSPAFVLFPLGTNYLSLPLALIMRDPFRTMKLIQALQFGIAFAGAAWLYGLLVARSSWRWFCGALYALSPFCALAVRGEPDFGSIFALMPVVLSVNILVARKVGSRGLPFAALLCSVVGSAFYVEHLLVVGIPLLLLTGVFFLRSGVHLSLASIAAAAIAFGAFPMFVVLPTIFGPHPMWFVASYLNTSELDAERVLFAQGWIELLAGVARENLLGGSRTNATPNLPWAIVAGTASWMLISLAVIRLAQTSAKQLVFAIIAIGVSCEVLALGPQFPLLGAPIWWFIGHAPILQVLRTPDRFAEPCALLIAIGAAAGASYLTTSRRVAGCALAAVAVLGYGIFDIRESAFKTGSFAEQTPDISTIGAKTELIGGRVAVLGVSRLGSMFEFPPYSPSNPTVLFAWPFFARFLPIDGGAGLLRRAAVRSIVTTPTWSFNIAPNMPTDMAPAFRRSKLLVETRFPSGASVFTVRQPRDHMTQAISLCTVAGPNYFDRVAGLPELDRFALVHDGDGPCAEHLYINDDYLDRAVLENAQNAWSGAQAFGPGLPLPPPPDFPFARFDINTRWYSHQYEGQSLLSPDVFVAQSSATSKSIEFAALGSRHYDLYVRSIGASGIAVQVDGRAAVADADPARAQTWTKIELRSLHAGIHRLTVSISPETGSSRPMVIDELAVVDHQRLLTPRASTDVTLLSEETGRNTYRSVYLAAGDYAWWAVDGVHGVAVIDGSNWAQREYRTLQAGFHHVSLLDTSGIIIERRSAFVASQATTELAELYDGYWSADEPYSAVSYPCDLVNTCIAARVGSGVDVHHRIPTPLAVGSALSVADFVVCAFLAFASKGRRVRTVA